MSDQTMSDLREALEQTPDWFVGTSRSAEHHKTIRSAARRFLALTETGPKQAVHLPREQSYVLSVDGPGLYFVIPADYLTEEE